MAEDGSFLWLSGRSGWSHAYHYTADGTLLKQITSGRWELRTLYGVDATNTWIYFAGTERSPIGDDIYRIKLDGSGLERLSKTQGHHDATSAGHSRTTSTRGATSRRHRRRFASERRTEVRALRDNRVAALTEYKLSTRSSCR